MTSPAQKVLIVDDSENYTRLAHRFLRHYSYATNCDLSHPCWECPHKRGCKLKHAHNWEEVSEIFERDGDKIDVVLLDVNFDLPREELIEESGLPGAGEETDEKLQRYQGFHILRRLRRMHGQIPVVLMTSQKDIAFDEAELSSDLKDEEYTQLFEDEDISAQSLAAKIERARAVLQTKPYQGEFFWGTSRSMRQTRRWIEVVARGDQPVLVLGETGTGKSFFAEQVIHPLARPSKTFCAIDLSTIPENLVAAELFGTAKGAYSGAVARQGRFEFATGGTLFLDEIGNLSLELQKQLLSVLQTRRVTRLGENKPRPVDVKLIVATNENLEDKVKDGSFRVDLYQRLNPAAKVVLPPLRDRKEDLRGLCNFLLQRIFASSGNRQMLEDFGGLFKIDTAIVKPSLTFNKKLRFSPGDTDIVWFQIAGLAWETLAAYDFPGNTRELEMILANAVLFSLADALAAGRIGETPVVRVDVQVLRRLIGASRLSQESDELENELERQRMIIAVEPSDTLNNASRQVEKQYFEDLYLRCGGSFQKMASQLLKGSATKNARKVQLRFNNLGLSVRDLRDRFRSKE